MAFFLTPFSIFLKLLQYAGSWMNLSLGTNLSYELLSIMVCKPHCSSIGFLQALIHQKIVIELSYFLLSAIPHAAVHERMLRYEWVEALHSMNLKIPCDVSLYGCGAEEWYRGRQPFWKEDHIKAERRKYFLKCLFSDGERAPNGSEVCLASHTDSIAERAGGKIGSLLGSAALLRGWRPGLGNAHSAKGTCLKKFISNTWFNAWWLAEEGSNCSKTHLGQWPAEVCSSRGSFCSAMTSVIGRALCSWVPPHCAGSLARALVTIIPEQLYPSDFNFTSSVLL